MSRWRTQLDLRASFVALLCACVYFGGGELLAVFLPAAVLHELGHILAARCMGLHIRRLTLSALGAELQLVEKNTSFLQDLLLCVSGPAVNLLLAAACAFLGRFPLFLGANLLLGAFNLLPVLPLDGGNGLFALLSLLTTWETAEGLMRWFSRITALAVAATGLFVLCLDGGKPYLLLLGVWLFASARRNG